MTTIYSQSHPARAHLDASQSHSPASHRQLNTVSSTSISSNNRSIFYPLQSIIMPPKKAGAAAAATKEKKGAAAAPAHASYKGEFIASCIA